MITQTLSIQGLDCKSDGCVQQAVELTSGDLRFAVDSRLRAERSVLTGRQKSAEGVLATQAVKARTVLRVPKRMRMPLSAVRTRTTRRKCWS